MGKNIILETERILLREFTMADAPFILRLVNEPSWLEYIGDRKVYTLADAERYLTEGSIKSYKDNGYGFWAVILKSTGAIIGSAGLAKRDFLEDVDIGYAFLPEYTGLGYAAEIVTEILRHAKEDIGMKRIVAITAKENHRSIKILHKIGLEFEKCIVLDGEEINLFSVNFPD